MPTSPGSATYDPAKDPRRGHGLRLASDDLFDCRWKASHEFRLPEDARSGIYAGRIRFQLDGEERLYHTVFIVKKAAGRPRAPIAFLCSTNTWRAYAATPFSPTWKGLKKSIGNNGFANSPGDPPAFCFYRPHHAGQGTYQIGLPDALADRRPVHAHGPRGVGLQPSLPAGSVHAGLARNAGL